MLSMGRWLGVGARATQTATVAAPTPPAVPEAPVVLARRPLGKIAEGPAPEAPAEVERPPTDGPTRRRGKRPAPTAAEEQAMRAADATRDEIAAVAHDMATLWHFPWRTYGTWPARLKVVGLRWMGGELAAARSTGRVLFRNLLQSIAIRDRSPHRHLLAGFVTQLGESMARAAVQADGLDGIETIDALESVACYTIMVRARYAKVFTPATSLNLQHVTARLLALVEKMRGYTPETSVA